MRLFVAVYPPAPAVADLATFVSSLHVGRAAAEGVNTRLANPLTYHLTLAFLGEVPDERLTEVEQAIGQAVDRYHARAATQARRAARANAREHRDAASAAASGSGSAVTSGSGSVGPSGSGSVGPSGSESAGPSGSISAETSGSAAGGRDGVRADADLASALASRSVGAAGGGAPSEVDQARKRHVQAWPAVPELALSGGGRFGRGAFTLMWVGVAGDLDPMRALHKALRSELKRAHFPYDERPWKPHLTVARPGNRIPKGDLDADRAALDAYVGKAWPARELFLVRSNLGPEPTYERLSNWLL